MIIECCKCGKILGQKYPYWDKRVTHTYCHKCFETEMKRIKELHERLRMVSKDKKLEA